MSSRILQVFQIVVLTVLLSFNSLRASAQQNREPYYVKGSSVITIGHGIGNIWKTYLKQAINFPGITYKVSSLGPYALIYEYGFSKRISGGVAAGYSRITGKYSGFGDTYTDRLTIFSLLARANYHFLRREKWDLYAGGGAGYVNSQYANSDAQSKRDAPGEFGYSGQLGGRYLLKDHWGVYAEAGYVGGSFVQIGLSLNY